MTKISAIEQEADRVIHTQRAVNKRGAAINVSRRNRDALLNEAIFRDPAFRAKIDKVREIGENYFATHSGIYINYRPNRGQPFAVVKFVRPQIPAISDSSKTRQFRNPLKAMGVEVVYSKRSRSMLLRIHSKGMQP